MPISETIHFRKLGLAPELLEVPGIRGARVTPQADYDWEARMAEAAKSKEAQLEAQRRRAQAAEAGRIAAQSPRHVSRRQLQPKHRRRG